MAKKNNILKKSKKIKHNFIIKNKDFINFQKLSQDFNLIHTNKDYAKKYNFKQKVVYGGILLSKISYLIGEKFPIKETLWVYLKTLFLKPIYINEKVLLEGVISNISLATSYFEINFKFSVKKQLRCKGTIGIKILKK